MSDTYPDDRTLFYDEEGMFFDGFRHGAPDRILSATMFDTQERNSLGLPQPFPNTRSDKWRGAYLWFDTIENTAKGVYILVPLYAGRTNHFPQRMSSHVASRSGSTFMEEYWELMFDAPPDDAVCIPRVALWYEKNKSKQVAIEQSLIVQFEPMYNKKASHND